MLPFLFANALYTETSPAFSRQRALSRLGYRPSIARVRDWNQAINRKTQTFLLKHARFDIFQPTYYDAYFLDVIEARPFVLEVVDMIPEIFPDLFASSPHLDKQMLIPRAAAIITNSVTTKRDLLCFHAMAAEKVHVVPLGAPSDVPPATACPPLPDHYVLFVGKRGAYKNFARFALAMRELMRQRSNLRLVCVGGGQLKRDELELFRQAGVDHRVHVIKVDDDGLQWAYRRARLFVYPSLYEGFGIPIVEAFTFGCPAALAEIPVFREVADDAALFFDPHDGASIGASIARLLDDEQLCRELVRHGGQRVKDFSWRAMAEQTAAVYRQVQAATLA